MHNHSLTIAESDSTNFSDTEKLSPGQGIPMKSKYQLPLFAFLIALSVAPPLWIWQQTAGDVALYFLKPTPPGQLPYLFSKLFGLWAIHLLWLQMVLALLVKTFRRSIHRWIHPTLGFLSLFTILIHVGLFISAVTLRSGHFPVALLTPRFTEGYYNAAVTLGLIGLWLFVITAVFGVFLRQGWHRLKKFHQLSYIAFGLVFTHGLLIGTETRLAGVDLLYKSMAVTLVILWVSKLVVPNPAGIIQTPHASK